MPLSFENRKITNYLILALSISAALGGCSRSPDTAVQNSTENVIPSAPLKSEPPHDLTPPAAVSVRDFVGLQYSDLLSKTRKFSSNDEGFQSTLNGPQEPGKFVVLGGRKLLVFEMCMAHSCGDTSSVVAIDPTTDEFAIITNVDGKRSVSKPNAGIERLIAEPCSNLGFCDWPEIAASGGSDDSLAPLTTADLAKMSGGASCSATNSKRQQVFYTEGNGLIRFEGKLIPLYENGIGTGTLSSTDGTNIVVEFTNRHGKITHGEESTTSPKILTVKGSVKKAKSYEVLLTCGS